MVEEAEVKTDGDEDNPSSPRPAGHLLGKLGLWAVVAGLLLAAWYGQVVIVVLLGLVLSAAGLARLWSRLSLVGVRCQRLLSERRVFPGEQVELKLRLVNRKLLPLPWIQLDDRIPVKLSSDTMLTTNGSNDSGLLSKSAALLWYTGVNWKERLYCHRRGYYRLGPVTLTSGDIFGFYPRSITDSLIDHIIVYPRIFSIARMGVPSLYPLGETTAERRIFEDPTRVIGVRDYSPRDSRRHIHWKATARRQELQVKIFEPTTTLKVAIFLHIESFKNEQDEVYSEEDFEMGISTAASIADYLTERHSAVGLMVNSRLADTGEPVTLPPGSSAGQMVAILEALAKVTPSPSCPFEEFLQAERAALPWGTTLVFILYRPSQSLTELLIGLKESGHKLLVLQIGDAEEGRGAEAIAWHHVRQPEDFHRTEIEATV
jgi:uncharacterized protein (DUF58 family)